MAFSTSFKQDLREDLAHILTANEHDEAILYWQRRGAGLGPGRTIRAIIEPDENYFIDDDRQVRLPRIEVYISRDQLNQVLLNDANPGHGGVFRPERGDQICLIERDPERKRYVHTGFVIEENPHSFCLEFKLHRVRRSGNEHVINQT